MLDREKYNTREWTERRRERAVFNRCKMEMNWAVVAVVVFFASYFAFFKLTDSENVLNILWFFIAGMTGVFAIYRALRVLN